MMDSMSHSVVPIAQLSPGDDSSPHGTVRGVVTIIWPYSASKQSISLLLVERDFRLRRKRGQVRVTFRGHSATALSNAKVSSGDELLLSLDGAIFKPDTAQERTPGRGIEWQLEYSRRLHLLIDREGGQQKRLEVNRSTPTPEPEAVSIPAAADSASESPPLSPPSVDKDDQVWDSPAFLANRAAYENPFLTNFSFDDDDEETYEDTKRSKRTKFGRRSGQWRFAERKFSPTKSRSARSTSEGISLASKSAFGDAFESSVPEVPFETSTNVDPADTLFLPGPFEDTSAPDDGVDDFQTLSQGFLTAPSDDFAIAAASHVLPLQLDRNASFPAIHNDAAAVNLTSVDIPAVVADIDFNTDPAVLIPRSDFLTSPEFPGFPTEISPLLNKTDSTSAPPVYKPAEVTNIEQSHALSQIAELQSVESLHQESDRAASQPIVYDQAVSATFSKESEVKSGTANEPIEIIDLDSNSSSVETSPQRAPIQRQDEQVSEEDSASEDGELKGIHSSSNGQSDEESNIEKRLSSEELYNDEESEEVSDPEQATLRRTSPPRRKTSPSSEESGPAQSEGEADAEGEDDDDDDEVYEIRRTSALSSSQSSGIMPDTQNSIERERWASEHSSIDDLREESSDEGDVSTEDAPDPGSQDAADGAAEDEANQETFAPARDSRSEISSATEPKTVPRKATDEDQIAPTARLVTRERPGDPKAMLNDGTSPPPSSTQQRTTSKASDVGAPRAPKEQSQPAKRITFTRLTAVASKVAKSIKENFQVDQNTSFAGFRTPLSYFTTIASLAQFYNRRVDTIAVVVGQTEIQQAEKGPQEYYTTIKLADPWTQDIGSPEYASAQIYRRKKTALPECGIGDAIMLRQFKVQQRKRQLQLLSCESSAWAVFTKGHKDKIAVRGPPVELGDEEGQLAEGLQQWWAALEHTTTTVKEAAILEKPQKELRIKREVLDSTPPPSPERHVLRDGSSYADGPGEAVHKLRDGATYSD